VSLVVQEQVCFQVHVIKGTESSVTSHTGADVSKVIKGAESSVIMQEQASPRSYHQEDSVLNRSGDGVSKVVQEQVPPSLSGGAESSVIMQEQVSLRLYHQKHSVLSHIRSRHS
jgi:hypothetical protein